MQIILLSALFWACSLLPASAASLDLIAPYLSGQYYSWDERIGGRTILKERGPLVAAGIVLGEVTNYGLAVRGRWELFGGVIGYDGETQAPSSLPVKTDVTYFGSKQEFDLGYRRSVAALSLEPFAGVGYRWWLRDLQDTTASNGQRVSGYTEWWQTAYTRLGGRGSYRVRPDLALFAEGGAKYPFYTGNSVDFADFGTTTFRPGGEWSGFAEAGADWDRLRLALFYEGFRYSRSPVKAVGARLFFQPDSTSDIFGLSVGWSFR